MSLSIVFKFWKRHLDIQSFYDEMKMIAYVAKAIDSLVLLIQMFLEITCSIGQVIVVLVVATTSIIITSLKSLIKFFQIVYEDNVSIFTEDLPHISNVIIDTINHQCLFLHDLLMTMYSETTFKINVIIDNLQWSFGSVFKIFGEVLYLLKKTIVFCGETLWLILTFVPVHLPYLLTAYLNHIRDIIVTYAIDTYMALLKVTNFLSDVPLESFIGIISAILIIRSCIHFRDTITSQIINCYWFLVRKCTYLYYVVYNYFMNTDIRLITQMVGDQQEIFRNIDSQTANDNDPVDALCVICQERQKCVLTLPCRHVCLCTECCMRLYGYQRTCPICRTFIYHSVTIYL